MQNPKNLFLSSLNMMIVETIASVQGHMVVNEPNFPMSKIQSASQTKQENSGMPTWGVLKPQACSPKGR
jgi:hypothetical protein